MNQFPIHTITVLTTTTNSSPFSETRTTAPLSTPSPSTPTSKSNPTPTPTPTSTPMPLIWHLLHPKRISLCLHSATIYLCKLCLRHKWPFVFKSNIEVKLHSDDNSLAIQTTHCVNFSRHREPGASGCAADQSCLCFLWSVVSPSRQLPYSLQTQSTAPQQSSTLKSSL